MLISVIINLCAKEYQDVAFDRISQTDWISYLNDAQRAIVLVRPDAHSSVSAVQLAAGTKQSLPAGGMKLLDATRNMGSDGLTPGLSVTISERQTQDLVNRNWHNAAPAAVIDDVLYDDKNAPLTFWVSPPVPASPAVYLELVISIAAATVSDYTADSIGLADLYATPIQMWMLGRAYSLATTSAAQFQRAASYFQQFFNVLGVKARADLIFAAMGKDYYPAGAVK